LGVCAIIFGTYLLLSFAMKAFADPPTSPYTPGETLNPSCGVASSNCTVLPPLFSSTTLPQGGVLFMNDASGTVSANTSSLSLNAASSVLTIAAAGQTGGLTIGTTTLPTGYYGNVVANNTAGLQWNLQNLASTSYSETVFTMDTGNSGTNYGGVGINNSNFAVGQELAGDVYVEASSTGGIDLETQSSDIQFFIGATAASTTAGM